MKEEIQFFNFESRQVRTLKINGEPWFVGKDIAKVLGYANPSVAISKNVPYEFKGITKMETPGGKQNITIISEPGLYKLVFKSHAESAERFTNWIARKVLPAIRRHGAYMTDEKAFDVIHNQNGLADLLQQAADQLRQKDIQIEEMKPKALFADAVSVSKTTVLIGELAKMLKGNGIDIGATRLFKWMREHGYLINRKGADWNMPTQKAMNLGLFKIKETTITHSDGHVTITKTPKVTGKGQQYFINKFLKQRKIQTVNAQAKLDLL